MVRIRSIGVLAALTLTLACGGSGSEGGAGQEELVLRSYAAPGQAQKLADVLNELMVFGSGDNRRRVGNARVAPGDQVLVLAPTSVLRGLAEVIEAQLDGRAEAPPTQIATTYWFVAGRSVKGDGERPGELDEIRAALDEIDRVQGPQEYRLIERMELRQAEGFRSQAHGSRGEVRQKVASASGGHVMAEIGITFGGRPQKARIDSVLNLRTDQFLVLSQVALDRDFDPFREPRVARNPDQALAARVRPAETALYVIVRAKIDPHS